MRLRARSCNRAGRYAGLALAAAVQILDPELLVIGGGLTRLGAVLLDPALSTMRELVQEQMVDSVRVEMSRLGEEIGVLGAAARAFSARPSRPLGQPISPEGCRKGSRE